MRKTASEVINQSLGQFLGELGLPPSPFPQPRFEDFLQARQQQQQALEGYTEYLRGLGSLSHTNWWNLVDIVYRSLEEEGRKRFMAYAYWLGSRY